MQIIQWIQRLLLSEFVIFAVLIVAFVYLTRRALALREYAGYGLGWLVGIFIMVVYSSTLATPPSDASTVSAEVSLSFFQIVLPSLCGGGFGLAVLWIIAQAQNGARRQSLTIAIMTALCVVLIFFLFVAEYDVRRMIGIFALAFGICATLAIVLFGQPNSTARAGFTAQGAPPSGGTGRSRLDEIRDQFRQN
jgi:hypothetical protein